MAEGLILDSEAVSALANAKQRGALAERARVILTVAHERMALVRVPAPVLAEVCRGSRHDAAVHRLLKDRGVGVIALTLPVAEQAGALLARNRLASRHAVDAFVVATALSFDRAVIATGDPKDLQPLAAGHARVRVFAL